MRMWVSPRSGNRCGRLRSTIRISQWLLAGDVANGELGSFFFSKSMSLVPGPLLLESGFLLAIQAAVFDTQVVWSILQPLYKEHSFCPQKHGWCFFIPLGEKILWNVKNSHEQMGLVARKSVFGGLRATQAQTSLRICAVWSAPLLFAFWKDSI